VTRLGIEDNDATGIQQARDADAVQTDSAPVVPAGALNLNQY
jgi:hypothetical protein